MQDRIQVFERNRDRLRGLAYRLLGSVADADDMIQEVYVRWHEAAISELCSPDAWLTTVMTRLCVDRMRERGRERDTYLGSWLPEPLFVAEPFPPDHALDTAADLSMALLVMLERLAPEERAAFLLHDVFDYGYRDIGVALGKTQPACRQLLHRARKRIGSDRPRFQVSHDMCRRLLTRFLEATRVADRDALLSLLAEDATLMTDSGGRVRATRKIIRGNNHIASLLIGVARKRIGDTDEKLMLINGELGIVTYVNGRAAAVLCLRVDQERITALYRVLNPDKLRAVPPLKEPHSRLAPIEEQALS